MEKLNLKKENLKKFGVTMGIALLVISLFILFRHRHSPVFTSGISLIFFVLAFSAPGLLRPVYIFWMRLAFVLGWINTRLILFIIFYLVFTPIGLVMRLFGADLLDKKIEKTKDSYWKKREKEAFNPSGYERQF